MLRISVCLAAMLLVAGGLHSASAETAAEPAAKSSRAKFTIEHLREMRAKWILNKPKLRACRKEVRAKGLVGDARWFYMEDCMGME
jgi:hypothetical protein